MNGVEYRSLDEVPADLRSTMAEVLADVFADRDGAGLAELIDGVIGSHGTTGAGTPGLGLEPSMLDQVPEPYRTTLRQALESVPTGNPPASNTAATNIPTGAVPTRSVSQAHSPIVRKAGWSRRAKLIATFVVIDIATVLAVVWWLTR